MDISSLESNLAVMRVEGVGRVAAAPSLRDQRPPGSSDAGMDRVTLSREAVEHLRGSEPVDGKPPVQEAASASELKRAKEKCDRAKGISQKATCPTCGLPEDSPGVCASCGTTGTGGLLAALSEGENVEGGKRKELSGAQRTDRRDGALGERGRLRENASEAAEGRYREN